MGNSAKAGNIFFIVALLMLVLGISFGCLASLSYIRPGILNSYIRFEALRPMHVTSVIFWILLGATASVYSGLEIIRPGRISIALKQLQVLLWIIAIIGIFYSYLHGRFGGKEYWEFDPIWSLPLLLAWLVFLYNFIRVVKGFKQWPVYIWMWMTGIVFFLFTFIENYLWVFPFFKGRMITEMTLQWKVNGSLVGAWNQLLYGTVFFLMEKISNDKAIGKSRIMFAMYFLGLFNLMFNWGHHIYTLPTASYIRYVGYLVSMTEWVFFIRIVYNWKKSISAAKIHIHYFPYRFILAADFWVMLNMAQAILMSIPAFNVFTHGTHITVAHAMGTTIGVNTMIVLAASFEFMSDACNNYYQGNRALKFGFWLTQFSLLLFYLVLNAAGIVKGIWSMSETRVAFTVMMTGLKPYFITFVIAGFVLMISLLIPSIILIKNFFICKLKSNIQIRTKLHFLNSRV